MTTEDFLQAIAKRVRRNALASIYYAKSGHPGGTLSVTDILVYLYAKELNIDHSQLDWPERSRLVLSKGHACPALYAMAAEIGLIPYNLLKDFRKLGSPLQGHPHLLDTPWVETSTGSLGQGFSAAIGMAMGLRYQGNSARVYVILGDGELQEGEVWEGAMCAAHYQLDNLCAIVDYNKMQSDDWITNILGLEPLPDKWLAFNWHVIEIDGHDYERIEIALNEAKRTKQKPTIIIAHTIKGKGVSYMEGSPLWHGSLRLTSEELVQALKELDTPEEEIARYIHGIVWQD